LRGNTFLFTQGNEPLLASNVRVAQSQIVGFNTNITSLDLRLAELRR
jgi:hypothetical protein